MTEKEWDTDGFFRQMMHADTQEVRTSSWKTKRDETQRLAQEKKEREEAEERRQEEPLLVCTFRVPRATSLKDLERRATHLLACHEDIHADAVLSAVPRNVGTQPSAALHSHLGPWEGAMRDVKLILDPVSMRAPLSLLHDLRDLVETSIGSETDVAHTQVFFRIMRRADVYKDF